MIHKFRFDAELTVTIDERRVFDEIGHRLEQIQRYIKELPQEVLDELTNNGKTTGGVIGGGPEVESGKSVIPGWKCLFEIYLE